MKTRPLIIDKPSLQSLRQRYLSATFTFIFWTVWIFLWTPLLTLLGWLSGLDLVYIEMLQLKGYQTVIADFGRFLICIAVIGGILGIWAAYNFFRFKDLERRAAIKPVTTPELAAFFGINPQKLTQQQKPNACRSASTVWATSSPAVSCNRPPKTLTNASGRFFLPLP